MAGKFINKSFVNSVDALTAGTIQKVKNANYVFNNKPPVIGDWYNINKDVTTLDEGTGAEYVAIGKNSPMRYNLIKDAVFYAEGIRIEIDLEYDEDGLTTAAPNFSGIVLPNTWIPYSGDYVTLKQAGKEYIYRINSVSYDTIDNNNNVYKFEAMLDQTGKSYLDKQVVETYRMVINNVGTSFNAILKEEVYDCVDSLDSILVRLKDYFVALFYTDEVQTFTFNGPYGKLYDPYMIEFLIRNDIMSGSTEYVYVHHEIAVPRTFSIEYDKSIFRALETKTKANFTNQNCIGELIDDCYSLFYTTIDKYYKVTHKDYGMSLFNPIDGMLISNVKSNELLDPNDPKAYYNIIVKYFNDAKLDSSVVSLLERIDFAQSVDLFYAIPMIIYVLEYSVKKLMS